MKKLITLVLAVVLVSALAVAVSANPDQGHSITASRGTPVVDGVKDDIWDTAEAQTQDQIRSGEDTGTHVTIRFLYDDENLYFLGECPDASLWTKDLSLASMTYNMDGCEINLSLSNNSAGSINSATDAWVGVTPYGDFYSSQANWLVGSGSGVSVDNETFDAEFVEIHTSLENDPDNDQANPWYVEVVWHIKAYDEQYAPKDGMAYGFEISYNDNADYNNRTMCIGWSDITDGASGNPSLWGQIVLGEGGEAAAASDEPELANYAKGAAVTVSSTETADFPGELAVDGDMTTRWASAYTDDETITIDLGTIKPIGYIELNWETALASDFEIYTGSAEDNLQEHTIATVTGNADTKNVFEFDLTTARYITIHCSKRATEWGNSLYEVIVRKSADEVAGAEAGPEGYPSSGVSVPDGSVIINGERIGLEVGWGDNAAAGRDAAFDGDLNTFFDPLGTGNGWAGIDAGEEYTLTKIVIHPREGWTARFNGAEIDGSNDPDFNDYTPIWISVEEADSFRWFEIDAADFDDTGSFRYYRYFNNTSHGDVAEVELYGYPTAGGPGSAAAAATYPASGAGDNIINGTVIGNETGWGDNAAAGAAAAFDGDAATFFDPLGVGDGFCGIDAGESYILDKVAILSRDGWADRFAGAMIQGSNDGENWTTLWTSPAAAASTTEYTIVTEFENNTGYSQYRYFNETNHGDVAEVEFYGAPGKVEAASRGLADVNAAADGKNVITAYEFVSGTEGFGGEGSENLWDGETGTKFCTNQFPAESVVKLDGIYNINGFTMATANDNADYNGRSPNAWTISVSADGENWTELAKGDDTFFEETNFTYYAGEGAADGVSYVKFSADGTASGTFQVSELTVFGDKVEELSAPVDEVLDAKAEAPNTFDFGVTAAVAAVISLAGFAVSKKKH